MINLNHHTNQHRVHQPSLPAAICNPQADSKPIARPASSHNLLKLPERCSTFEIRGGCLAFGFAARLYGSIFFGFPFFPTCRSATFAQTQMGSVGVWNY
jgi:hypothetical protein